MQLKCKIDRALAFFNTAGLSRSWINKTLWIPALILTGFFCLCFFSQRYQSVTVDEFSHFPSGLYNLTTADWEMDKESPPLIKCLPALSAVITHPDINPGKFKENPNAWGFGYDFMYRNFDRYIDIYEWGRVVIITISCFGGWILYRFAHQLYGFQGAIFALFLFVLNPNVIAHSGLTTIDAGATVMILFAIYAFWRYLKRMAWQNAAFAGLTLGLAQLSKFTSLILYPIYVVIFILLVLMREGKTKSGRRIDTAKSLISFGMVFLISILVINVGYLFSDSFFCLSSHTFSSDLILSVASSPLGFLPIPLPLSYFTGFDIQLDIASGNSPFYMGYLMGEYDMNGWWYYYLIALIVKNPEVFFLLVGASAYVWIRQTPDREASLCVWVPILGYILYFSFFTTVPIGVRFLLPVFPLLFLAAGYLPVMAVRWRWGRVSLSILAVFYFIPSAFAFPDYISYFNRLSGGAENGYKWLIDSNLDWGQDLVELGMYMERNQIKHVKLGYFGRVDPRIYDIPYQIAERKKGEGIYVISANFLMGRPYYLLAPDGKITLIDFNHYRQFRKLRPKARIGNTLYLFN